MTEDCAARARQLMSRNGGAVIFGPQFVEGLEGLQQTFAGKCVFASSRPEDIAIPDSLAIDFTVVFCHWLPHSLGAVPSRPQLDGWRADLLAGIKLYGRQSGAPKSVSKFPG